MIARARKALRREFEARLAPIDLTVPQISVLWSLWEGDGKTIGQLSQWVASDGPTLTSLLDRLEAKDLICRQRDSRDRRTVRIFLKDRGREIREEVGKAGQGMLSVVRSGMSDEQIEELRKLLLLLCETVERGGAEECPAVD